jgi:hypothetical protein
MQKVFAIIAAALGLGWIASDASANSVTFVATGPTTITVGETTTFDVVMQIDPGVSCATFQVDVVRLGLVSANNAMAGTNASTANFSLRQLSFFEWPGTICVGDEDPICSATAPGAPSAGNAGGLSLSDFTPGTYTIGSYTVVGQTEGIGTVSVLIKPGFEWLDGGFAPLPNPTSNVLAITIPEPGQVLLLGSGVVALAVLGRSRIKR